MRILEQVPVVYNQAGEPWGIIPGYTVAAKTGTAQEAGNYLRVELHRHRPGQEQRAGRRGQPAGSAQWFVLRHRRRRARSSTR